MAGRLRRWGKAAAWPAAGALIGWAGWALDRRRRERERSHQEALRVAEALAGAQLRAQLAENAAALGKLAASLTHEINTPLGALKSSVDSLLLLAKRCGTTSGVEAELRQSIEASAERIRSVVARLERFTPLADSETKAANLNDLVADAAMLLESKIQGGVELHLDLQPLPKVNCRPQLLMFVFSSLLNNALDAVDGAGRIEIATWLADSTVEISVGDNGRGMRAEEVDTIFDPGFRVSESRVSSANWSLFNVRQIVYEHGGDIRIDSTEGHGTRVCVSIPICDIMESSADKY
jgi:signal transduction histidine kinase